MTHRFRRSVGIVYTRYLWIVWTHEAQPSGFRTKFRGTACTQFLPTYEINLCVICFIEWAQKFGKKINSVFFQFYRMHGKIMRPVITGRMVMKKKNHASGNYRTHDFFKIMRLVIFWDCMQIIWNSPLTCMKLLNSEWKSSYVQVNGKFP